jgi:hypothetical protein
LDLKTSKNEGWKMTDFVQCSIYHALYSLKNPIYLNKKLVVYNPLLGIEYMVETDQNPTEIYEWMLKNVNI